MTSLACVGSQHCCLAGGFGKEWTWRFARGSRNEGLLILCTLQNFFKLESRRIARESSHDVLQHLQGEQGLKGETGPVSAWRFSIHFPFIFLNVMKTDLLISHSVCSHQTIFRINSIYYQIKWLIYVWLYLLNVPLKLVPICRFTSAVVQRRHNDVLHSCHLPHRMVWISRLVRVNSSLFTPYLQAK